MMYLKDKKQALASRVIEALEAAGFFRNCIACFHFEHTTEKCKLANQRPPAKVIVEGCSKFELDDIPF